MGLDYHLSPPTSGQDRPSRDQLHHHATMNAARVIGYEAQRWLLEAATEEFCREQEDYFGLRFRSKVTLIAFNLLEERGQRGYDIARRIIEDSE